MAGLVENCNRYQRSSVTASGADNDVTRAVSPSTVA